jgi:hypothetical protein
MTRSAWEVGKIRDFQILEVTKRVAVNQLTFTIDELRLAASLHFNRQSSIVNRQSSIVNQS